MSFACASNTQVHMLSTCKKSTKSNLQRSSTKDKAKTQTLSFANPVLHLIPFDLAFIKCGSRGGAGPWTWPRRLLRPCVEREIGPRPNDASYCPHGPVPAPRPGLLPGFLHFIMVVLLVCMLVFLLVVLLHGACAFVRGGIVARRSGRCMV